MVSPRLIIVCALFVSLLLSACQPVQAPTDSPPTSVAEEGTATPTAVAEEPAATITEVTVTAVEYSFDVPESLSAGWTRITVDNQGELPHDFLLFKIEEGKTMEDVMTALEAEGPPEWAEFYGGTAVGPGESKWFASNLTEGMYVYLSFGEDEAGLPDAAQGMIGSLEVMAATGPAVDDPGIEADASIQLVDYQFVVQGEITTGDQVLRIENIGSEMHEVIFFKMHEGKTMADFMAMMEAEMGGPPEEGEAGAEGEEGAEDEAGEIAEPEMPGEFAGAIFLSPGIVTYAIQEFEAGTYVLVCFIPSPENDMKPHVALGMIQQVIVNE